LGTVPAKMREPILGRTMGSYAPHGYDYNGNQSAHHRLDGWGMLNAWEERAACKDTPLELWFGDEHPFGIKKSRTKQQTAQAKAICASCPVLSECRSWALETQIPYGIVGMMTEAERQHLIHGKTPRGAPVTTRRKS
jgi:WhiB family redox-sensing transcriptional regulator